MASADDVRKLAALARIQIDDAQLEKFSKEFDGILSYVGQIERLQVSGDAPEAPVVRNVFRADGEPTARGVNTEKLVAQFPSKQGNALSVKKIISHD